MCIYFENKHVQNKRRFVKIFFLHFFKILVRYFNLKNYHNCLKAHLFLALYTLHLNFM